MHFRRNPSAGNVDATWLAAWVADANSTTLINAYKAILRSTDRLEGVLVRATRDPSDPTADRDEAYRVIDAAGTRTPASSSGPDEATCLIEVSGDLAGRRYRGRNWMPPPLDGPAISNGEFIAPTSTYWVNVLAFLTELTKTTYPSGGAHYGGAWNDCDMVVFSRAGRLAGGTYYARARAVSGDTKVRWLRSRNPTLA